MAGQNTADHLSGHEHSRQAHEHVQDAHHPTQAATARHGIAAFRHGDIAALAYGLWQARGCPDGSPQEDWFRAAEELRSRGRNIFERREEKTDETEHEGSDGSALHEVKGKVKEKAGQAVNNPNLQAEGQAEKLAGKIQKKVGQIEKVFEK